MFTVLCATILFILIFYMSTKNLNYWKKRGVKYLRPLPFFGNMLPNVIRSMGTHELLEKLYYAFPEERYVGFFQFSKPTLLIRDPELIKSISVKHFENFTDHAGFIPVEVDPLWGKNLFASKGDRWRDLRHTVTPVFTTSKMRAMFVLMEECAKQFVDYIKQQNKDVIELEMKDTFTRYTNDVIASTAFGIECNSLKFKNNEFLLAGRELCNFTGVKRLRPLLYANVPSIAKMLKLKIVGTRVGNFFKAIVEETIRLREEKNIVRPDLIHLLMLARKEKLRYENNTEMFEGGFPTDECYANDESAKNSEFLTIEDITAQALVFFFGGFDTSSSFMSFIAYELAVNPNIQKKLKNEIIKTWTESDGQFTYEHLFNMKYMDMVTSETLRKWTQATWINRKCTKNFIIEPEREGEPTLNIKVGDICWFPVYSIHRDPKYYPNPDIFDPERFSDENRIKITPNTYLPFGIGPRNCIGSRFALLETKILFFYLLMNFDIVPIHKTQIPLKLRKDSFLVTAENGFPLGLKRMQNSTQV